MKVVYCTHGADYDIYKDLDVHRQFYQRFLDTLEGGAYDTDPSKMLVWGRVEITYKSGKLDVTHFFTGEEFAAFSVNGVYYRGSSDSEIGELYRDVLGVHIKLAQ